MAVYRSKVTSKGRLTIPLEVRKRLGIKPGDELEFVTGKAATIVRRARRRKNPFDQWFDQWKDRFGGFPGGIDEINAWIREMRGPI